MFPFSEVPQIIYMINDSLDGFRAKVYCNEKIYDMKSKKERHRTFSICRNPYTGFLMLSSSYMGKIGMVIYQQ